MVYQECFPSVSMSKKDLHFISPIQFDSWLASPLDFPKVLVSFRVLAMVFPLYGFPRGFHVSIYIFGTKARPFRSIIRAHLRHVDLILAWVSHLCPEKKFSKKQNHLNNFVWCMIPKICRFFI